MDKVVLKAAPRSVTGKQVRALRRAGQLPGVIYGHKVKPVAITMDAHEAALVLGRLTSSSLVSIDLEGKEYPSLVREKQRNVIKGTLIHVDFQAVSLTEKIRASVSIVLNGNSPAVKDLNISVIANIGDGIHVRDISLPENVTVLSDPDEMIILATAPREEEEEEVVTPEAEAVAEGAEPEVIEKGKKEEEEGEEEEK
jgi:large subunit ribosomal protein L25